MYLGSRPIRVIYGSASKAGEIRGNKDVMDRAYTMGQRLGASRTSTPLTNPQ